MTTIRTTTDWVAWTLEAEGPYPFPGIDPETRGLDALVARYHAGIPAFLAERFPEAEVTYRFDNSRWSGYRIKASGPAGSKPASWFDGIHQAHTALDDYHQMFNF